LYVYFYTIKLFIENSDHFLAYSWLYLAFALAISHLFAVLVVLYLLNFVHVSAINFASTAALLTAFYVKICQVDSLLLELFQRKVRFISLDYVHFRREFTRTLVFFLSVNEQYGRLFCCALICWTPLNLFNNVDLIENYGSIYRSLSSFKKFFMLIWIIFFGYLIFIVHLLLTYCTKLIHAPSKSLFHILVANQRNLWMSTRTRLRMANQIATLHTNNRYGFTYGDFGLVSLANFGKVNVQTKSTKSFY